MESLAFSHMESTTAIIFVGVTVNLPVARQESHILVKAISSDYEQCLKVITAFRWPFLSPKVRNARLCFSTLNLIFMTKLHGIVLDLFSIFEAERSATEIMQYYSNYSNPYLSIWFEMTLNLLLKASHFFWKIYLSCFLFKRYQWVSEAKHFDRLKINPQIKTSQLSRSTEGMKTSTSNHEIS